MAIGQESEGRGIGGFLQRSQRQWEQQRMIDAQEEMRRQREMQAEEARKRESDSGGQEKKKDSGPASQSGLNRPSSSISLIGSAGSAFPSEARINPGVGGSTGRIVHFDPAKAPSYLDSIAQKHGIDPTDFKRMAWIESKFDPNARASSSSAGGLFQFTNDTARAYGLSNKFDGVANAEAAARLWNDNKAQLTKALGREPTAGELYLAHQQGLGGAQKLLSNPNAPAASLVGNKAVVNNGGSSRMSAGEFARMWTNKFDSLNASGSADGATPRNRDAGNAQSPIRVADAGTTRNDASPSRAQEAGGKVMTANTPAVDRLPTDPRNPAPEGYFWDLGGAGDRPRLISRATGQDMAGQPVPATGAVTPPSAGAPSVVTPASTTPGSAPSPATGTTQSVADVPLPPRRPEMGPPMPEQSAQPATNQPTQPQQQAQQEDGIGGFFKDIGSFFSGEPIKDKYGREWDPLYGFEKPPGEIAAASQRANEAAKANDAPSMLDRSSAATATSASADSSKSIFSDMPDIGAAFTPALNFFSSLFG